MCLKTIFIFTSLIIFTIQLEFPEQALNYTIQNECDFNWTHTQNILLYQPTVNYIKNIVNSQPIADDFYEKYSKFVDKFGARPSGSSTLERAIDHMVDLTFQSGLNDVWTESVKVPHWQRGYESLTMILPRTRNMTILGLGPSVPTPTAGIVAEVVVVNSFTELETIAHTVPGKIVLFNAHFTSYQETVKYRQYCAIAAAKHGAIAVLVRSITPFSLYTPHTGSLYYEEGIRKIPAAAVTLEDADFLQRVYNRRKKVVVKLKMFNDLSLKESRNVIIDVKGQENPDNIVIVSGHIDSWDVGKGAIDDGGGMMISWFVPVILNHLSLWPKRTIRSILWTAEEPGYIGAASYLQRHSNELDKIDFIMESDAGTFEPLGLEVVGSPDVRCLIAKVLKLFAPMDAIKNVNITGSDIELFLNLGIPGASLLNQNDQYFWFHHTQADTLTVQNKTNVVKCAAFWAAVTYVIADLPFDIPP